MNVGELKQYLDNFPDDLEVLTARDPEGNGFNRVYYAPAIYWIEANSDKYGYVEHVYSSDDLEELDDALVEARLVI